MSDLKCLFFRNIEGILADRGEEVKRLSSLDVPDDILKKLNLSNSKEVVSECEVNMKENGSNSNCSNNDSDTKQSQTPNLINDK